MTEKPYDARTLRYVARQLRSMARLQQGYRENGVLPRDHTYWTIRSGECIANAREFERQARIIEKRKRAGAGE